MADFPSPSRKSPTSVLKNPVWMEPGSGIGLGILDSLLEPGSDHSNKKLIVVSRKKPQLKIQIPIMGFGLPPKCSSGSPSILCSEMELSEDYTRVISRGGHVTKMTRIYDDCVVDSCFGDDVDLGLSSSSSTSLIEDENGGFGSSNGQFGLQVESFLSFCFACRKSLGDGTDIYMYRGEKAFCSDECRYREMLMEEEIEKNGAYVEDEFSSW